MSWPYYVKFENRDVIWPHVNNLGVSKPPYFLGMQRTHDHVLTGNVGNQTYRDRESRQVLKDSAAVEKIVFSLFGKNYLVDSYRLQIIRSWTSCLPAWKSSNTYCKSNKFCRSIGRNDDWSKTSRSWSNYLRNSDSTLFLKCSGRYWSVTKRNIKYSVAAAKMSCSNISEVKIIATIVTGH